MISISRNCFAVKCGGTCCITLQWASGKFCKHKGMVIPLCTHSMKEKICYFPSLKLSEVPVAEENECVVI